MSSASLTLKGWVQTFFKDDRAFVRVSICLFFGLGLIGILNHAMWRDELTIWLIVRDSESWKDFLEVIRYEPHPALWYFCVAVLFRLSQNPAIMQLFHLGIGTIGAYLFLRYSPFSKVHKILFIFGYLPFYEYLIISRNYSLGILFAFWFCTLYETRRRSYLGLSILLFLISNANAYSLFIAVALGATLILEYIFRNEFDYRTRASFLDRLTSLTIFILGAFSSIAFLIPPGDNLEHGGLSSGWTFVFSLRHFFTALARLWNSYIVVIVAGDSKYYSVVICGVLSLVIIAFVSGFLIKKHLALFFYLFATTEILLFTYTKFLGAQRHFGHLYIVFIIALWLANYYPTSNRLASSIARSRVLSNWMEFASFHKKTFITIILLLQLIAGIIAFNRDLVIPYSASKATASYIKANNLDRLFIVGSEDVAMAPISGYLNQKIYYPERQGLGSFVLFNTAREKVDIEETLNQVERLLQEKYSEILLILNYELKVFRNELQIIPVEQFTESLIYNEKYYLYYVTRTN
ncbi:hypothetical protein IQ249_06095 [Lusitaniella coriacea LEGE 07157]|uniref:Uncharacterized protein n=1 Tax=Lusitaniella coriacea LEGE 07157 TaxID=945747 RepID=A0A8J7AXL6_9CYAN|nr:hypothetical protein [Lusitaniella coriacea]MBE9115467.1 hypothetical protein [Lusitaniella coriacea LEGE 07157]